MRESNVEGVELGNCETGSYPLVINGEKGGVSVPPPKATIFEKNKKTSFPIVVQSEMRWITLIYRQEKSTAALSDTQYNGA